MGAGEGISSVLAGWLVLLAAPGAAGDQPAPVKPAPCEEGQSAPIFSELGTTDEAMEAFLVALQKAVAREDRPKVASMIRYPIAAWARTKDVTFRTPAALLASYEGVFTPRLKKTIAEASTPCLFTNSQGAMIHDGEIWLSAFPKGELKITKINRSIDAGP